MRYGDFVLVLLKEGESYDVGDIPVSPKWDITPSESLCKSILTHAPGTHAKGVIAGYPCGYWFLRKITVNEFGPVCP